MKQSIKFITAILLVTGTFQALGDGSCKNCVDCQSNGKYQWCNACFKSAHVWESGADGKCEGAGIEGCLVQVKGLSGQICLKCATGYGLYKYSGGSPASNADNVVDYKCYKIDVANAVEGYYLKGSNGRTLTVEGCKRGYSRNGDKCKIANYNAGLGGIKNCESWDSSSCRFCKAPYKHINPNTVYNQGSDYDFKCYDLEKGNLYGIQDSNMRPWKAFIKGKWTRKQCDYYYNFTVNDISAHGYSGSSQTTNSFGGFASTSGVSSPSLSYSSRSNNWVECSNEENGAAFGKILKIVFSLMIGLGLIVF